MTNKMNGKEYREKIKNELRKYMGEDAINITIKEFDELIEKTDFLNFLNKYDLFKLKVEYRNGYYGLVYYRYPYYKSFFLGISPFLASYVSVYIKKLKFKGEL